MNWMKLETSTDIEHMMEQFGAFHDSCLKELYMWTDSFVDEDLTMAISPGMDTNVRILFQRQFQNPSAIELVFEGVHQFHIHPSPQNYDPIIYGATLIFQDSLFYWADQSDWKPENDSDTKNSWISAERLKWRDASSWMGEANRYGVVKC